MKNNKIFMTIFWGVFALLIGALTLQPISAAPPAAPTPVANVLDTDGGRYFVFQTATALTADTDTRTVDVLAFDSLDIAVTTDHGTVNTATFTVEWSNDGTNWDKGPAVLSANGADTTELTRVPVFGRYVRVEQDVTNANPLTVTITAIGR